MGRVVEVDGMARLDEVQAVEVEQTQFCILDEDLAPGQNRYMLEQPASEHRFKVEQCIWMMCISVIVM